MTASPDPEIVQFFEQLAPPGGERAAIDARKTSLKIDATARDELAAENTPDPPQVVPGDVLITRPRRPTPWRISHVWPAGGNVILAAGFKSGKTILLHNLARSWCDHTAFLGKFPVSPPDGQLVIIDAEMPESTAQEWLTDQRITHPGRLGHISLRGRARAFNPLVPAIRERWAAILAGAGAVVLDCLGPVLAAVGLDENSAVDCGRFLAGWEALLADAGIGESLITHHMGHATERTRGASRLRDWPDAEWRLVRAGDDPASVRYFSAFGRDVDVTEARLSYDPGTRRLSLTGGSRADAAREEARAAVLELLANLPGGEALSGAAIERKLAGECPVNKLRAAVKALIASGEVVVKDGPRNAALHSLNPTARHSPTPPR